MFFAFFLDTNQEFNRKNKTNLHPLWKNKHYLNSRLLAQWRITNVVKEEYLLSPMGHFACGFNAFEGRKVSQTLFALWMVQFWKSANLVFSTKHIDE